VVVVVGASRNRRGVLCRVVDPPGLQVGVCYERIGQSLRAGRTGRSWRGGLGAACCEQCAEGAQSTEEPPEDSVVDARRWVATEVVRGRRGVGQGLA
jgi:hypothetical protein